MPKCAQAAKGAILGETGAETGASVDVSGLLLGMNKGKGHTQWPLTGKVCRIVGCGAPGKQVPSALNTKGRVSYKMESKPRLCISDRHEYLEYVIHKDSTNKGVDKRIHSGNDKGTAKAAFPSTAACIQKSDVNREGRRLLKLKKASSVLLKESAEASAAAKAYQGVKEATADRASWGRRRRRRRRRRRHRHHRHHRHHRPHKPHKPHRHHRHRAEVVGKANAKKRERGAKTQAKKRVLEKQARERGAKERGKKAKKRLAEKHAKDRVKAAKASKRKARERSTKELQNKICRIGIKPLTCASKSCGKSFRKCGKCVDGKYIHLGRFQHNSYHMAAGEKAEMASLDAEQTKWLHRLVTYRDADNIKHAFLTPWLLLGQYFPRLCPYHVNNRVNYKVAKNTKSKFCAHYSKMRKEEAMAKAVRRELGASNDQYQAAMRSKPSNKRATGTLDIGDSLVNQVVEKDAMTMGYGRIRRRVIRRRSGLRKALRKVVKRVRGGAKRVAGGFKKMANRFKNKLKSALKRAIAAFIRKKTPVLAKMVCKLMRKLKSRSPSCVGQATAKLNRCAVGNDALRKRGIAGFKAWAIAELKKAKPAWIKELIMPKLAKLVCKESPDFGTYGYGKTKRDLSASAMGDLVVRIAMASGPKKKQAAKEFSRYFAAFVEAILIKGFRSKMAKRMNPDTTFCNSFAPIISTGTKDGDKLALLGMSTKFGGGALLNGPLKPKTYAAQRKILFGDQAYELYKVEVDRYHNVQAIVCAARFETQIRVCNTCCCRSGLISNRVTSILLNSAKGCSPKQNPRLCQTPVTGDTIGPNGSALRPGVYKIRLGNVPKLGQYPDCEGWFSMIDATYRYFSAMTTAIAANSFHGATNQGKGEKHPVWRAWTKKNGKQIFRGTGCLAGGR